MRLSQKDKQVLNELRYSEHDWNTDEDGTVTLDHGWASVDGQHFGPKCQCCGYAPCLRCVGRADTCVTIEHTCGC